MATKKKLLQAAAGNAGGEALNVEDVFSTYLYEGNSSTQTITNGIDLSGEGGLVWVKGRDQARENVLQDTERGTGVWVGSNLPNGNLSNVQHVTAFNSNGFSVGTGSDVNFSGEDLVSWTFRKAPKFFTCLTYSGDGVAGRTVSHNLGSEVGCLIVKRTDTTGEWMVWHKDVAAIDASYALQLQSTNAAAGYSTSFNSTAPTSTEFTLGNNSKTNNASGTYVAYLFAHNDGDGEFGPAGDADIIKCGSYTAVSAGTEIDIGFEPQWIMIKKSSASESWYIYDSMRGVVTGGGNSQDKKLRANSSGVEAAVNAPIIAFSANGFVLESTDNEINGSGGTYIYMAIRRGTKVPESGTEVYSAGVVQNNTGRTLTNPLGHPSDWAFTRGSGEEHWIVQSRLTGKADLKFDLTNAEVSNKAYGFGNNTNYEADGTAAIGAYGWNFRRAPGFFDVVAYSGNSTAGRTVSHNLTVAPEMMWVKQRPYSSTWRVYHSALGNVKALTLNDTSAAYNLTSAWNSTTPTATEFTLGTSNDVNENPLAHIAYLFASLAGVSKVSSYTGNGSSQTINAGFTAGARFILIKRTDSTGDWYVWDTSRGVVTGNSPHLSLNTNVAEVTSDDSIDPDSSGFIVNQIAATNINVSSAAYIYYAVA